MLLQFIPWFIKQYFFFRRFVLKYWIYADSSTHFWFTIDHGWIWEQHVMHGTSVYKMHRVFKKKSSYPPQCFSTSIILFRSNGLVSLRVKIYLWYLPIHYDIYNSILTLLSCQNRVQIFYLNKKLFFSSSKTYCYYYYYYYLIVKIYLFTYYFIYFLIYKTRTGREKTKIYIIRQKIKNIKV